MKHVDYVQGRASQDPRFEAERAAAAAELDFISAAVNQRVARNMSIDALAEEIGVSVERLESIEGGDSLSFNETLWLCHALGLRVEIGPDFRVELAKRPSVRLVEQPAPLTTTG